MTDAMVEELVCPQASSSVNQDPVPDPPPPKDDDNGKSTDPDITEDFGMPFDILDGDDHSVAEVRSEWYLRYSDGVCYLNLN